MTDQANMNEEQQNQWVREQYQVATKYLADKGLITESVAVEESRYLVPVLAVWKLKLLDGTKTWVISGDLPTDHSSADVAPDARDALRHFSLKWQLQAENLSKAGDVEQNKFAELLISRAEGLYRLYEDEKVWGSKPA
ncbi:DUF4826 family protein [Thalassomonas actiniarum]|uniref:DUF4826 family protein n=1 Tax=Thalassomonas actiniarum TaxID=485447 RepID=A0AAE9YIA9_9GAMM|nr:DUF4826 family protein [Thalassomonas actiniarum]WDD96675.1 DUF4826 family protein [Thalassomonas actiniarum]